MPIVERNTPAEPHATPKAFIDSLLAAVAELRALEEKGLIEDRTFEREELKRLDSEAWSVVEWLQGDGEA